MGARQSPSGATARWTAGSPRWRCRTTSTTRAQDVRGCCSPCTREREPQISSRIGVRHAATEIDEAFDFIDHLNAALTARGRIDYLICDEAHFYSPDQVEQLAQIVDGLTIDVEAFGIATDFQSRLFPGSKRLFELADRRVELQVVALCWCGARGTQNARVENGRVVREGSQVLVGDTLHRNRRASQMGYELLCRKHWREGVTRSHATQEGLFANE